LCLDGFAKNTLTPPVDPPDLLFHPSAYTVSVISVLEVPLLIKPFGVVVWVFLGRVAAWDALYVVGVHPY